MEEKYPFTSSKYKIYLQKFAGERINERGMLFCSQTLQTCNLGDGVEGGLNLILGKR